MINQVPGSFYDIELPGIFKLKDMKNKRTTPEEFIKEFKLTDSMSTETLALALKTFAHRKLSEVVTEIMDLSDFGHKDKRAINIIISTINDN